MDISKIYELKRKLDYSHGGCSKPYDIGKEGKIDFSGGAGEGRER